MVLWRGCGYPAMSIKNNPVIVNSGGMSGSYMAENWQHSGMNRKTEGAPQNAGEYEYVYEKRTGESRSQTNKSGLQVIAGLPTLLSRPSSPKVLVLRF